IISFEQINFFIDRVYDCYAKKNRFLESIFKLDKYDNSNKYIASGSMCLSPTIVFVAKKCQLYFNHINKNLALKKSIFLFPDITTKYEIKDSCLLFKLSKINYFTILFVQNCVTKSSVKTWLLAKQHDNLRINRATCILNLFDFMIRIIGFQTADE
ncbi:hypothetical protein BpHYR1_019936, partial [Brachionus plicatilis]